MKRFFLHYPNPGMGINSALLIFRLLVGGFMLTHGWPKLATFGERVETFRDPLGIGSTLSLTGTVFGEVFCAVAIMFGLFTRLASIGLGFVMAVAGFIVHAEDSFSRKEKALFFLICCIILLITGPGKYSLDRKLLR